MKHISFLSFILCCLAGLFLVQPITVLKVYGQDEITQAGAGVQVKSNSEAVINVDNIHETILSSASVEHKQQTVALPHEYSLNNGLKIILLSDKAYPFVSCFSWYKVGSCDDPAGMTGLTHLVEHLLFQNIGNFPGNQWANAIVRNGGEFSGFTSEDFTAFYSNLPTYQLELAIRGEAERMRNARFTKADVAKEVEHLLKEAQAEEQDLPQVLNREVHALAYERHPYHNPPGGWPQELERLNYAEARAHYDRYFHPNNATLVVVGGFDEQIALNLIQKYFVALPKAENLPANVYPQERPQLAERQIKLRTHSGKESVILAYKVSAANHADAPAIAVLEQLLNGQLHDQLRSKLIDSGLCSAVHVAFEQKHDPGLLVINCSGIPANGSAKLIQALDAQLAQLRAKLLTEADIKQVVQQTEFAYYCDGDGPYSCAFQIGFFATLGKGEMAYSWPQKIQQVTAADILRVARTYLNEENRVLGQIAVATVNQSNSNGGKKIDWSFGKDRLSVLPHAKNVLVNTLNNEHFRLAAYQSSELKLPAVAAVNVATVQNVPVNLVNPVNKEILAAGSDQSKTVRPQIRYKVLRNGLRVFVLESHLKPLVQISGSLKAGRIYEQPNNHGISRLLAAILNSGDTRINKQQLIAQQYDLGLTPQAMLNFESTTENISFRTSCLSKDFSSQIHQLLNCLREPRLQNADFEAAKTDVAVLLRQNEKKPEVRIERALLRSLIVPNCVYYPIHPEEEINSIANFRLNDLVDFCHEHVGPASTSIVVCGDVDTEEVFGLLDRLTEGWLLDAQTNAAISANTNTATTNGNTINQTATKISRPLQGLVVSDRNAYKSSLIMPQLNPAEIVLGRIISVNDIKQTENYWAAMLITDCALSSHPIFSRVREQFDLNPQLLDGNSEQIWDSKIFKLADKLIWSMHLYLKPQSSSSAAVITIQNELTEFSKCGLRQDEVVEAKRYLIGNIPIKECFNLDGLTQFISRGINELNEIEPMAKVQRIINSLKYEDINEFIARIFKPHLASIVVAGPKELIKQVRQPLPEPVETNSD